MTFPTIDSTVRETGEVVAEPAVSWKDEPCVRVRFGIGRGMQVAEALSLDAARVLAVQLQDAVNQQEAKS